MNNKKPRFPALDDLPEHERRQFEEWLAGSQMPINGDGSQDYYQHDYER